MSQQVSGNGILWNVGQRDRYPVPFLHPELLERACEAGELRVGEGCPVVDACRVVWVTASRFIKDPGQGALRYCQVSRNALFIVAHSGTGDEACFTSLKLLELCGWLYISLVHPRSLGHVASLLSQDQAVHSILRVKQGPHTRITAASLTIRDSS